MDNITIGPLAPGRWLDSFEVSRIGFGDRVAPEVAEAEHQVLVDDRLVVATEGGPDGNLVGTCGSYPFAMTVPGGGSIPVAGVTNVGVLPTHRRRGIFRRLMQRQHDDFAAGGVPVAVLNASDASIYGRIGYGMASRWNLVRVRSGAAFHTAAPTRDLRMMRSADATEVLPALYEAARPVRPGTMSRSAAWWEMLLGPTEMWKGGGHYEVVVAGPDGDDPGGYALYRSSSLNVDPFAEQLGVVVREVVAATPATHAALWRYLLDIDLVQTVEARLAEDDPLLWHLVDPRALGPQGSGDYLFVRILDVPVALCARSYSADIDIVMGVSDHFRPDGAAAGSFRLQAGPGGASCEPTTAEPDVVMGVDALGSLYLGGVDARVLAAAGRVGGRSPAVIDAVARAFRSSPAPFCATHF